MENPKRKTRKTYTPVEDTLLLQGVQFCGREWRSVLAFMRRHVEVLGEVGTQYLDRTNDKSLQERLRKRETKLLKDADLQKPLRTHQNESASSSSSKTKIIDEEYFSDSSEISCEDKDEQEIKEIAESINKREARYELDAENPLQKEPSDVLQAIKRQRQEEREEDRQREHGQKRKRTGHKKKKRSRDDKIDQLLDAIPAVLQSAEHSKTLKKWQSLHGLMDDDDSTSSDDA